MVILNSVLIFFVKVLILQKYFSIISQNSLKLGKILSILKTKSLLVRKSNNLLKKDRNCIQKMSPKI